MTRAYKKRQVRPPSAIQQGIIGELTYLRVDAGLHITELSKLIGYSDRGMRTWEAGECIPSFAAVSDWADYFGYELQLVRKEDE